MINLPALMNPDYARREFLAFVTSFAGGIITAAPASAFSDHSTYRLKGAIGLQAIAILRLLDSNPTATLREVSAIGYHDLQTIGNMGFGDARLAQFLAEAGLISSSLHVGTSTLHRVMLDWDAGRLQMKDVFRQIQTVYALENMPRLLDEAIATAKAVGQKTIIWSNLADVDLSATEGIKRIVAAFNRGGRQCADAGLSFAFHNGSKGFEPVGGRMPYDIILEETDPKLVQMEMDVYWATKKGINALGYVQANPGRYRSVHLKDMDASGEITGIGEGVIDFSEILRIGEKANVATYFVEYDQAPNPITNIRSAWTYLANIRSGKRLNRMTTR